MSISTLFVVCYCSVFVYCTRRENAIIIIINIVSIIHIERFVFVLFSRRLLILLINTKRLKLGIAVCVFVLVISFYHTAAYNATHGIAKVFLSVRLFVSPSVKRVLCDKRKKPVPIFLYHSKDCSS